MIAVGGVKGTGAVEDEVDGCEVAGGEVPPAVSAQAVAVDVLARCVVEFGFLGGRWWGPGCWWSPGCWSSSERGERSGIERGVVQIVPMITSYTIV